MSLAPDGAADTIVSGRRVDGRAGATDVEGDDATAASGFSLGLTTADRSFGECGAMSVNEIDGSAERGGARAGGELAAGEMEGASRTSSVKSDAAAAKLGGDSPLRTATAAAASSPIM